jgi:sugar/nucleoside kinase (ribokinase family)
VTVIGGVQVDLLMSPVTELPKGGASLLADQMSMRLGGAAANSALAFAEAGVPVRLVGCIGDDHLGDWMREELAPFGLGHELAVVPGGRSGLTIALQSPARDRTFLTYLGVNRDWEPAMIPREALGYENLLLCDYFMTPGLQGEQARGILDAARAQGARTFFDTAWDPANFPEATRSEVLELLTAVDVFLPNEAEAFALAGRGDALAAARTLQMASGNWVVVKLGSRGCLAVGPGGRELYEPAPAVVVADTTGAGDAFNAGLVQALSDGYDWATALRAAVRFASTIVARPSHDRYRPGRPAPAPEL